MLEEGVGCADGLSGVAAGRVGVTYDRFVALVDAEGEAADAAAVEGDEAGEDAGVEVLEEKLGGAAIVPAEAGLPDGGLGFEQGTKLARGEVPEVEDLELSSDGHELGKYSVELIAIDGGEGTIEVGGAGVLTVQGLCGRVFRTGNYNRNSKYGRSSLRSEWRRKNKQLQKQQQEQLQQQIPTGRQLEEQEQRRQQIWDCR